MEISKYDNAFSRIFHVSPDEAKCLEYQKFPTWDSVGHMQLMQELEETFGIFLEPEDVVSFSSYEKGIEILKKYSIVFDD